MVFICRHGRRRPSPLSCWLRFLFVGHRYAFDAVVPSLVSPLLLLPRPSGPIHPRWKVRPGLPAQARTKGHALRRGEEEQQRRCCVVVKLSTLLALRRGVRFYELKVHSLMSLIPEGVALGKWARINAAVTAEVTRRAMPTNAHFIFW